MRQVKSQMAKVKTQKPEIPKPKAQCPKPALYYVQQKAIFRAAKEVGLSIDDLRVMAGSINLGIASLSRLSLDQRHALIERLRSLGATAKNPEITRYDYEEEARAQGKLTRFPAISDKQLKMLTLLADQVQWREPDGYLRFCHTTIKAPAARNAREVTTLRLALQSLITQQQKTEREIETERKKRDLPQPPTAATADAEILHS